MSGRLALVLFAVLLSSLPDGVAASEDGILFRENFDSSAMADGIPDNWSFFTSIKTISIDTERAHSGARALKLVDEHPTQAVGLRSPRIWRPRNALRMLASGPV